MFQTPILFLIFNRPDTTQIVFESIRRIKPSKLYVAADGPRLHKANEAEQCEETRAIIKNIDWPCEVKTLFRENNLGCKIAVSSSIQWFFENEEQGIILEDDCLPDDSFYTFCESLLDHYKDDERIMHIGGANFQKGISRTSHSYYFSNYNNIWGWASWRRAWKHYRVNQENESEEELKGIIGERFKTENEFEYWFNIYRSDFVKNIDTWDYQWTFAIWKQKGLSILPNINLVSNIGFDNRGTHTKDTDYFGLSNLKTYSIGKLSHPADLTINEEADLFIIKNYLKPSKWYAWFRVSRYRLKSLLGI